MSKKKINTDVNEAVAKLMATENLRVQYSNVRTAMFDIENRVLLIPMWKNITSDMNDLFICHEVGHALYTDKQDFLDKFLKDKNTKLTPREKKLKTVFNIVEDARIERLVQAQFPGTKQFFRKGYSDLLDRDFFKLKEKNIPLDKHKFLDRINLHYKAGIHGHLDISFKEKEKHWLPQIDACNTIQDVFDLSEKLLQYVEENPEDDNDPDYRDCEEGDGNQRSEGVDDR